MYADHLVASADRRPVDPPPVVELKIFEGEGESKKDVTFSYNANFFLYATLENARIIAPARSGGVPAPLPVLTGMPVAGVAYLDRPAPAGYFIFPDLSVRHEGKYRLSFSLYEELRDPKDADAEASAQDQALAGAGISLVGANAFVYFRLEVKSEPFTVYSAKKFPGLTESTQLSRVVADQGCRVRIRRDVRMRRRETKSSKDFDEYDEEDPVPAPAVNTYPRRFASPEAGAPPSTADRARSVSNVSVDPSAPYTMSRAAAHESSYYSQQSYQPVAPPPPPSLATNLQQPAALYEKQRQYGYPTPSSATPPAQPGVNYGRSNATFYYPQTPASATSSGYHAAPYNQYQPQPHAQTGYAVPRDHKAESSADIATDSKYPTYPQHPDRISTPSAVQALPPLKTMQPPEKLDFLAVDTSDSAASTPYDMYVPRAAALSTPVRAGGKRSFGRVFDQGHINQAAHGGSRPEASGKDVLQIACEEGVFDADDLPDLKMLSYRRANGSTQMRKIPSPVT